MLERLVVCVDYIVCYGRLAFQDCSVSVRCYPMFTSSNGVDVAKARAWFAGLKDGAIFSQVTFVPTGLDSPLTNLYSSLLERPNN